MPGYYTYLISSLPMLQFGQRPAFSFEKFFAACQAGVSEQDLKALSQASLSGDYVNTANTPEALQKWQAFDTALRNELTKIRSQRKQLEASAYLRPGTLVKADISRTALKAQRAPSLIESERLLDQARWSALDDLSVGHYFDLDILLIYALKLLILEKWQRIEQTDKSKSLEQTLN